MGEILPHSQPIASRKPRYSLIERAEHNRVITERTAERILAAVEARSGMTSDPEELRRLKMARVRAVRMLQCADPENVYIARDYHIETEDGLEHFDGHSRLACCGSFLCVHHQARKRRRSRKEALREIRSYTLGQGERIVMITLTHTTLAGLRCVESINLVNKAFRRWRRTEFYKGHIRGGLKALEWTVPAFQAYDEDAFAYHTHIHLAAVITADISTHHKLIEFQTALRADWTSAFLAECDAQSIPAPEIRTDEGSFLCDVKRLYSKDDRDPLQAGMTEIIKYITKPDISADLTDGQLIDVAGQERWPRQVEAFGCVHIAAREMRQAERARRDAERARRDAERAASSLDTENLSCAVADGHDGGGWDVAIAQIEGRAGLSGPGWRSYSMQGRGELEAVSRLEADMALSERELRAKTALWFKMRREFERYRLRHKFKHALFFTLGGDSFEGIERHEWVKSQEQEQAKAA